MSSPPQRTRKAKPKKERIPSPLERSFKWYWYKLSPKGSPDPIEEHAFAKECKPPRQWRFDFAWPTQKVAVELDGAVWSRGRHTRGSGFVKDLEKFNAAAMLGWRVLRFTRNDLDERPVQVIEEVAKALTP